MGYAKRFNPYACFPCDTRQDSCNCCDFGGDTARFFIRVVGCDGLSSIQDITATRTCPPASLPSGVSYPPSHPCCVWPFSVTIGDGCNVGGVNWGGSIYIVLYCDGTGYQFDVYCFDTDLNTWVVQAQGVNAPHRCIKGCENFDVGGLTVTLCCTWIVDITLPELDCCCPATVDPCCPCYEGGPTVEITINDLGGCCSPPPFTSISSGGADNCEFIVDGGSTETCTVNGNIQCTGTTWVPSFTTSSLSPACSRNWDSGDYTVTFYSCDPIDIVITYPDGSTITIVQV